MPTEELDQKVLDLQIVRIELNSLMKEFAAKRDRLINRLEGEWKSDRFVRYRRNEGTINKAKYDTSFKEYQHLDEMHKKVKSKMTKRDSQRYEELSTHFSAYHKALADSDVVEVRRTHARLIADIDECAEKMMQSVTEFKARRANVIAMVQIEKALTEREVKRLERALNLYAIVICQELPPAVKSAFKLLLSERLKVAFEMKEAELAENYTPMGFLMSDCVHIVSDHLFVREAQVSASVLTERKIEVYQHQATNTTDPQTINTLEGALGLLDNAATNYTLVKNLASICKEKIDASAIESEINQTVVEMLVETPGVSKSNVGAIYGIPVDESGNISSSGEKITAIEERCIRIRQEHNKTAESLPYPIGEMNFPYGENGLRAEKWDMEQNKKIDDALFEPEVV